MNNLNKMIAEAIKIPEKFVFQAIKLIENGATIPFISRYRKEATGGMDEVTLENVSNMYNKLQEIVHRKEYIIKTITELGKITDELTERINNIWNEETLEDIFLPYKPKRRTRAQVAKQCGLEPLAEIILKQKDNNIATYARKYITEEIKTTDDAIRGACDIIAEKISEDEYARNIVRRGFINNAIITAKINKGKEEEAGNYQNYFDFKIPLKRCSSFQLLAIRRGENKNFLKVDISPDNEEVVNRLIDKYVCGNTEASHLVKSTIKDCYKRLLKPSIENEFAAKSKEKADEQAISVFVKNLKQLLLAAPLGQKRTMGIDPGFRTGCKVVCLDNQGNLLHHDVIYIHSSDRHPAQAMQTITDMINNYKIEAIAIGNGTASRETESFIRSIPLESSLQIYVVSEQGASIYSASKVARDEFPDQDVTVRGAISIGRRLMDPLAELVKIDPKSIGVGQYQHDVDQNLLKRSLDRTVEYSVNLVGVNINTASSHLLSYVSGLGPQLASNIIFYRTEHGAFKSRVELLNVPRMGEKTYEQCAGFLRIKNAENLLDGSAVHPESYHIVEQMALDLNTTVDKLMNDKEIRNKINLQSYISNNIGLPTLKDILHELEKPGLDPREHIQEFKFNENIHTIEDLIEGMEVPGIITNITDFGAFVDIGVKTNGLIHRSQIATHFVSSPSEILSIHQHVWVRVNEIDLQRNRIGLSMKGINQHDDA